MTGRTRREAPPRKYPRIFQNRSAFYVCIMQLGYGSFEGIYPKLVRYLLHLPLPVLYSVEGGRQDQRGRKLLGAMPALGAFAKQENLSQAVSHPLQIIQTGSSAKLMKNTA